jgi:hypothetical protein
MLTERRLSAAVLLLTGHVQKCEKTAARFHSFRRSSFNSFHVPCPEREPEAVEQIAPILRDRRDVVLARVERHGPALYESFGSLTVLNYQRSYDECVQIVSKTLRDI